MNLILYSTNLLTALLLTLPLLKILLSPEANMSLTITRTVKLAFFTSLIPLSILLNTGMDHSTISMTWFSMINLQLKLNMLYDMYSLMFIPVALFVTWSILEFSQWYMATDPEMNKFFKYLLIFLLAMLILTSTSNMFQLFIGWEGVGIMSFLLIGWWFSRADANTAALQAIIYNRIGDIGLLITMAWLATNISTWNMHEAFHLTNTSPLLPILGFILAATGKSAQFGLHPWLPAAMEGPTPVSALLHSSTMVVAGIFLLLRIHPMMEYNSSAHTICLCLGSLTSLFASLCAMTQNDIKKIIAFSTTSQLGLMLVTIGLNQPKLAFFHMLTHAFFKAMLFLCSGSIIHNTADEQDVRKLGNIHKTLPITSSCMTIGNLALMGTPFLSGFFSKDAIIEALTASYLDSWAMTTTILATLLTTAYSTRMIFFTQMNNPRYHTPMPLNELSNKQTNPIIRLAAGTILSGLTIAATHINTKPQIMTMPTTAKLLAVSLMILGISMTIQLMTLTNKYYYPQNPSPLYFLTQLAFFNIIMHRMTTKMTLISSQNLATHLNDQAWLETTGPKMLLLTSNYASTYLSMMHRGLMKTYLAMFLFSLILLLLLV
uniref:NADH-ubiquinone oxidoreductase chain 5 n=1 Tax=Diplometopon zarudnyi TaxID=94420 RepID=Q66SW6_DIPZA|nr:NADH dehydrogenase subunit 5 [Diplometopon zarudnyi]AAT08513.1 NADH dehydrogenase subunit 5 [Diplometopon zarudnyi]